MASTHTKISGSKPRMAIPMGRWFGIEVGADFSWLIIFWLVTWSLAGRFSEQFELGPVANWGTAVAVSLLFFLSIILHEFGHSLTAIKLGVPVHSITLFIMGGMARIAREPKRPLDEFLIAIAGPAVSLALAVGFGVAALVIGPSTLPGAGLRWLAVINGWLFLFNMIPGFPLDGGRVLRAAAWAIKGDLAWGTRVAAGAGKLFAFGFIALGLTSALVLGNMIGGLWMAFIGWFLLTAARQGGQAGVARAVLSKIQAGKVMDVDASVVPPWQPLADIVEHGVLQRGERVFLVGDGGHLAGLLTLADIHEVAQDEWSTTSAQAAMKRFEDLERIGADVDLFAALRTMDEAGVAFLPVVDRDALVGILSRDRLMGVLRNGLEVGR